MDEALAILFGAIIAAIVSIASVYLTERIRDKRLKNETIYKPLYNEINEFNMTKWVSHSDFPSLEDQLDSYSKIRMSGELREAIEEYERKCDAFIKLRSEHPDLYEELISEVEKASTSALSNTDTKGQEKLFCMYFFEPLIHSHKNGKCLFDDMIDYSTASPSSPGMHIPSLKKWHVESPELFDTLANECSKIKIHHEYFDLYEQLQEMRNQINSDRERIKALLEKEIKKGW